MRKYLIEREIPGVGDFDDEQLCGAAKTSNAALDKLSPGIQWIQSFVAGDRTYCVYLARDEEIVRRHADISGFPASRISQVYRVIDPATAGA